jgi:beta-glucosidase
VHPVQDKKKAKEMIFFVSLVLLVIRVVDSKNVDQLLSSMSLEAKIGQMVQIDIGHFMIPETITVNYTKLENYIKQYQIGSVLNSPFSTVAMDGVSSWTAAEWRDLNAKILAYSMETSSEIPVIYGIDSIHGATFVKDAALMPQALNLAATFNEELSYSAGVVTAKDTRAAGIPWIFAPVLGLGLQPLWARFPETFGEDPHLAAVMGANIIKGLQYLANDGSFPKMTAACMKHFIAYSIPVDGHDRSAVQLPDRLLKQLYLPSFQAAVDAGVLTAMESYNEVGGVPMVSSKDYLKTLIRKQMNFTGFMVTDYAEIENLFSFHLVAESERDAVKIAMDETTIDMSMVPNDESFYNLLLDLVNSGEVSVSRIDQSVKRILEVKNTLGLLDDNYAIPVNDPLTATVGQDNDWDVSLNAARESITLVKNTNNVLPINSAVVKNIFLTGPTCNSSISQSGGWSVHWQGVFYEAENHRRTTIYDGLASLYTTGTLQYDAGVDLDATDLTGINNMADIMNYAAAADVIVVCLGEGTYAEKPGDIDDLALPAGQIDYVTQLAIAGKPIVLVMVEGRPRLIHNAVESSSAVVLAYQPGPIGGQAIAEILLGVTNPSGRLPFSYPTEEADIMYPYHHKPSDLCTTLTGAHTADYISCPVEWSFGAGLSYTTWEYSGLKLSSANLDEAGTIDVEVTVKNNGAVDGKHSVLLFVYDMHRRVTPEYKLLKRFSKVNLAAGASQTVPFTLTSEDLKYIGVDSYYLLESGEYRVGISPYVDCRSSVAAYYTISGGDSTSNGESMCSSFSLSLSTSYNAVCSKGCDMWRRGICGTSIDEETCMKTCTKQQWSWDYVNCMTDYYQGKTFFFFFLCFLFLLFLFLESSCTNPSTMQCYDSFSFAVPDSDSSSSDDNSGHSDTFVAVITVIIGLVTLVLGFLGGYYYTKYTLFKSSGSEYLHHPLVSNPLDESTSAAGNKIEEI